MFKKIVHFIFFGNYFYGCCTVALAIEANLQQNVPLNSVYFYTLLYCGTVLFYTYAYIQEKNTAVTKSNPHHVETHFNKALNKRTQWYSTNRRFIKISQFVLFGVCVIIGIYFLFKYYNSLFIITPFQFSGLVLTALIAFAYYGVSLGSIKINTRRTGWFKPFAIGLVWATAVTYVPILWYQVEQNRQYIFASDNLWFFVKNFMYISLLAILFDIKDYAADHNLKLKTFVVRMGLHKTIFLIIIPLTLLGFIALLVFALLLHFPLLRIVINSIPFVLLVVVSWSMTSRKSILYYLVVIDGLMLVKALCGISAYLFIK
jgi:hypothetical protein